ncbi:MAG: hypothetical protein JST30_00285 [Armatimonadetes bacterium]|nr:hypothetical protein [Armatimonadota bacterium]
MKNTLITFALFALVAGGCNGGSGSTTTDVKLPDGKDAKVTTDKDGSMKVEGEGVSAQAGGQLQITQDDLHAPFYPGAIVDVNKSMKVKTDTEESVLASMRSVDPPNAVVDFYKEKFKDLKFNEFKTGEGVNYIGETKLPDGAKLAFAIGQKTPNDPTEISIGYGKEKK